MPTLSPSTLVALSLGLHTSPLPSAGPAVHRGRVSYTTSSTLRTKPGRRDSPPTTSHACSDKLASWALAGVQGALLSALGLAPLFLDCLIIGGVPEAQQEIVHVEVRRAVAGRVGVEGPRVGFCALPFPHDRASPSSASCPESALSSSIFSILYRCLNHTRILSHSA